MTLGSLNSTSNPESFKKTAGKIIAGNTADGTKFNTCFVFFPIFFGLKIKTDPNLVK